MAIVRFMEKIVLERDSTHTEVDCTYSIVIDENGQKYLQIDTYGSKQRQIRGKKSQTIRFAPEAIVQLSKVLQRHF